MKKRSDFRILMRMLGIVRPLTGHMSLAVCFGTLGFLAAQFIPILGGYAVLRGTGITVPLSMTAITVCLPLFALLRAVFRFLEQRLNHYIAFTLLAIIRDRIFEALRRLCPAKLEGRDKGDLISLITSDVELLEVFYAHTVSPVCIAFITEAIMCLYIGSFHFLLGLLAFTAFFTIGALVPLIVSRRSGSLGDELRAQSGELAAHMLESIRGLDETLQYGAGEKRLKEISERTRELSSKQGALSSLTGTNLALTNTLILFFDAAMLVLCSALYMKGIVGFDGFLIPLIALISSFGPVTALSALGTTLQNTIASGARVLAVLSEEPETVDIAGKEAISFEGAAGDHITFSYGGETVLRDISLTVPQNSVIGIVGRSGCGKSTLLKLMMRFWNVSGGSIRISGRSIEEINTADLRRMESYMTQETQLFSDTIAGNVRIGRLKASQEEIEAACRKASVHDFIMTLPQGYETHVGELGDTLSGGERQRLGLARAFLHDAPFMLLDEPTSSLDSLNEAIVLKALRDSGTDKTVLIVSHRPSTMCIADSIFEMNEGRIS